jgi:hypothetical protein
VEGGKHPGELTPAKAAVTRILEKALIIVPAEEAAEDAGEKRGDRGEDDAEGYRRSKRSRSSRARS